MDLKELKLTPKRIETCNRLDLKDSNEILKYYPFKYEEYNITHLKDFKEGGNVFFEGELLSSPSTVRLPSRKVMTRFKVLYEEDELLVTIFNRPWARNLPVGEKITIIGKYNGANRVTALNYYTKQIKELEGIVPFYSLKEGISQNEIKKIIEIAFNKTSNELLDRIPNAYIAKHNLIDYKSAIENIHFPASPESLRKALSRLKYEEFLDFYTSLNYLKRNTTDVNKTNKVFSIKDVNSFIDSLPYELTKDQKDAADSILIDLQSNRSMYRLVQGEVGSGKTAIAMIGIYANYLSGYQSALMAPTEI